MKGKDFLKIFSKFMIFLVKNLTILIIVVGIVTLAGFTAYNCANVYVTANEGFIKRADVILNYKDPNILSKLFTQSYLIKEPLLKSNPYEEFDINNHDLRFKVTKFWVWPWDDETIITVEEKMFNLTGSPASDDQENIIIPKWINGIKLVTMKKTNKNWKIDNIDVVEIFLPPATPTPAPTASPTAKADTDDSTSE